MQAQPCGPATPPKIAALDFETFYCSKSGYSLTNLTYHDYVTHPRFDPYLVSIVFESGEEYAGSPFDFDWSKLDGHTLLIHNAAFDGAVLNFLIESGQIPKFEYELLDTCDMCACLGYPRSLKNAVWHMLGIEISKEARQGMDGRDYHTLPEEEKQTMIDYALDDSRYCLQLYANYGNQWPESERRISALNRENTVWGGIHVSRDEVMDGLATLAKVRDDALATLPWVADGGKPASRAHFINWIKTQVDADGKPLPVPHSISRTDPRFVAWLDKYGHLPTVKARLDIASVNTHIARLEALVDRIDEDEIIRFDSLYFGAHTGRFSGSTSSRDDAAEQVHSRKFNIYNLPKGGRDGLVHGVDIRGLLLPRKGHAFLIFDYGQIEPRITHWLAGNTAFLDLAKTEDIYQAAAKVMGWYPLDKNNLRDDDPKTRQLSKAVTIGLGYSMGAPRFTDTCRKDGIALEPTPKEFWNLDRRLKFILRNVANRHWESKEDEPWISEFITADRIVREWRQKNSMVVNLWKTLQDALTQSANINAPVHYFTLPSGRRKPYWSPTIKMTPKIVLDPETAEPSQMMESQLQAYLVKGAFRGASRLHGGVLTENLVQGIARDVLFGGILNAVSEIPPSWMYRFNVYDEVVFEVPLESAEQARDVIPSLMVDTTKEHLRWADGVPLEVEGGVADRYVVEGDNWKKYRTA